MGLKATTDPVVILGFGTASASAVLELRAAGYSGPLAVVTDGEPRPYSPVLTSYYAGGRIERSQCNPWSDLCIPSLVDELIAHARPSGLDVEKREVILEDGRRLKYSKLLIATGAHPVAPGFPQSAPYEPHVLRTLDDADRLSRALAAGRYQNVLVAGTSMVGLKVVETCLDREAHVTLLGRSPHILRNSAHPTIAAQFEHLLEQHSVALRLAQTATRCDCRSKTDRCTVTFERGGSAAFDRNDINACGRNEGEALDQGDSERFDEIVLAQGVKPNLDFVPTGAIEIDQGLVVDCFMRTSAPDVFAAGDVAQAFDLTTGQKRIIGLWQNAVQQGRCAARAIAAELAGRFPMQPFAGSIPSNVIHVGDILFASAGTIADGKGKRLDFQERNGTPLLLVYEEQGDGERLVGFNLLTAATPQDRSDEPANLIGRYRAEIRKTYLDRE